MRKALQEEFPELAIDTDRRHCHRRREGVYSDAYLEAVAVVPGRSLDYAIQKKIRGALEWRRSYGVDELKSAFLVDKNEGSNSIFVPRREERHKSRAENATNTNSTTSNTNSTNSTPSKFVPTQKLIDVCASGAFRVLERDLELVLQTNPATANDSRGSSSSSSNPCRMLLLYANTSCLNWWKTGVTAGLQYHVLVLEQALERIRNDTANSNRKNKNYTAEALPLSESFIVCVDTTKPPLPPPPLAAPRGMIGLMRKAYPDRIHRIFVGPVAPWLRRLYHDCLVHLLSPRSRDKIILLEEAPTEAVILARCAGAGPDAATSTAALNAGGIG